MNPLISVFSLSKAHGTQQLFRNIAFSLYAGDRIGLIGPNGAGKTSLLKILAETDDPDEGQVVMKKGLKTSYASQAPDFPQLPIEQFLIRQAPHVDPQIILTRARVLLGKAGFIDFSQNAALLSGGWKKRLDIVRALLLEPDFLFLDEPTNHLDLEGIVWLESFLKRLEIPFLVISHDRYFLENVTNKIIELNRCYEGGMLICQGNMSVYAKQKEEYLNTLEQKQRELSFKVREEVNWLRTSPKARTTKSQSRIREAKRLIEELSEVKQKRKTAVAGIDFSASERQTRKLLTAKNIGKTFGEQVLFRGLDITLCPGTRLGIVGKNGTGKSTLLKILSGSIPQDMGTIKQADELKIVNFDQHREQIPPNVTLAEALSPNGDTVNYRGQYIHVNGWAKRFLFSPERMQLPVKFLSGGEKARILIAKLMLQEADVLFLDEPTNDLDIQTLEIIEESLMTFEGAVVMISHDRCLMDKVCTSILYLEEGGQHNYFAGYRQWEESGALRGKKEEKGKTDPSSEGKKGRTSLSYKEKLELESMEQLIMKTEENLEKMHAEFKHSNNLDSYHLLAVEQEKLEALFARWQYLLDKK